MAQIISDQRDIDFILYEQLNAEELLKSEKYNDFNKKMFDMVIKEARNFSIKEILPTFTQCDRQGVEFKNNAVKAPECFKRAHKLLIQGEWGALTENPDFGGQGLPHTVAQAALEYMIGANYTLMTYAILGVGAGKMVDLFGTDKQKQLFLKKMYTCEWGSTMLLTEPQAGSDLGAITTTAEKNNDGTYKITGSKIFITNGEQDLTDNIIHPVLARVKNAPLGTKGISIFIVPKIWVNKDGSLGETNNIVCTGVEEKMGIHGSPTCSLSLGEKGECKGLLLGRENQGMEIMFHMMNRVRLEVGTQALTNASCAYLYALDYAKQRLQGRSLGKSADKNISQIPIIKHPDVKRMLIKMKSYVEGIRSLIYFTALCFDKVDILKSDDEKEHYADLIEILTPIVKAYSSEKGFDVCVEAMQIFGGYGYTREYPIEQLVRDCKITSIYEGANGIQAIDFLGRKLTFKKGAALRALIHEILKTASNAEKNKTLENFGKDLKKAVVKLEQACKKTLETIKTTKFESAFANAHPLLKATGDVVIAWMLLWQALIADSKLKKILEGKTENEKNEILRKNKNGAFYNGKIMAADFFINTILPVTIGKFDAIIKQNNAAVNISENSF
ncbi:MAG: acyl-CoA dehydrogenase [Desulfobacteraceae bacterium 4572_130]|nr:MAG: acyl-CoA dehydrogenase [Desulfobacteraceae bacterium 4572_130]